MLTIVEHHISGYRERTMFNASSAALTVAMAMDFTTAGERLTRSAAQGRYVAYDLQGSFIEIARDLYLRVRSLNPVSLNIAGNGMRTLSQFGIEQDWVNHRLYGILQLVHKYCPITRVHTGGQTGVDLAGAIAAYALDINTIVTMPRYFTQRGADGKDCQHTQQEIFEQVTRGADIVLNGAKAA